MPSGLSRNYSPGTTERIVSKELPGPELLDYASAAAMR